MDPALETPAGRGAHTPATVFVALTQHANRVGSALGLRSCSFRSAPAGSPRRLRRRDAHVTVLVDVAQDPAQVARDVVEGLLAANRCDDVALRHALFGAVCPDVGDA